MKINNKILIGMGVALCAGIAFYSLRGAITPYVSFAEARSGRASVQIIGKLDTRSPVRHENGAMLFTIADDRGERMDIAYRGPKPLNFEHAEEAVVMGSYDPAARRFAAEKLLVKCPSKYTAEQRP